MMIDCCTRMEGDSLEFKWKIKRFLIHFENSKHETVEITSPLFVVGTDDKSTWHLRCRISHTKSRGICPEDHHVTFYAVCNDFGGREVLWFGTTSSYISNNGSKKTGRYTQHKITAEQTTVALDHYSKGLLTNAGVHNSNDQFVFMCKIEMMNDLISFTRQSKIPKVVKTNFSSYLADLLQSGKFKDVTFVLGDEKLAAHKIILVTRSRVFAAMFEHPMRERNENEVIIEDIDVNVFKEMLRYIYINEAPNLKDMAIELLYAADKYGLDELKELCGTSIWEGITVEKAAEALILAQRHNLKSLLELTENFIETHIADVIKTATYKNIEKEHPQLLVEILRRSYEKEKEDNQTGPAFIRDVGMR